MPSDYFEEAGKCYEKGEYDKALAAYQYIVNKHPKNESYPAAFYNTGHIYLVQDSVGQAISVFKSVLKWHFDEREQLGGDIMSNPYANYKHNASQTLCGIYYKREQYDSALYYLSLSDTVHPYIHFCGNAYAMNDIDMALRYADIYQRLKQPEKAINKLLPAVFITLENNSAIIDALRQLLKDQTGLKAKLDQSVEEIYPKEIKQGTSSYTNYYFKFLGTEIAVPESYDFNQTPFDKQKSIDRILSTDFYKMIAEL
ncbi:tetratricopeptide repeat protein [Chitinophaga agrisoli]|uniref:Tetratricopeptide repeat protein n=1 Tax=Chitinophaga agrisoli TaxID=2607653 RepID=A0A5B2VLZ7_9BACT|nr:tetratricopeptide repeat protein [Chitinophaga agrisoli]KAA2239536.1 tetratricopeptide repeat protein [Chitinophaga agrisoli]